VLANGGVQDVTIISRSFSAVLKDILDNLQDIIRSEARLAKAEIRDEFEKSKDALAWMATSAVAGLFAVAYLLLCGFFALRYILPDWAAAAALALILTALCGLSFAVARRYRNSKALRSSSSTSNKESELERNH
jgi:hypothetical protein